MRRFIPISTLAILLAVTLAVPASASTGTDDSISPELSGLVHSLGPSILPLKFPETSEPAKECAAMISGSSLSPGR